MGIIHYRGFDYFVAPKVNPTLGMNFMIRETLLACMHGSKNG
jgi:hypothetical protein